MSRKRQKLRLALIFISFFLFPATFYYFSPVLVIEAASRGIINGSWISFLLLFIFATFLGRAWCGWLCPAAGCQEQLFAVNTKHVRKGNWIKWLIWVPWVGAIAFLAAKAGGYKKIEFFYQTAMGLSVTDVLSHIIYLLVLFLLIVIPSLAIGKRSFCHHLCWMAPFMILGATISKRCRLPRLHLLAKSDKCTHCYKCDKKCPMSLPVNALVSKAKMDHHECILCGSCVDGCEQKAIDFSFGSVRR